MNVHTGAILAMGSYPTYDPSFYTQPHTKAQYDAFGNRPGDPLVDRADQGGYPTGSAFKPITATAALEDHLITRRARSSMTPARSTSAAWWSTTPAAPPTGRST